MLKYIVEIPNLGYFKFWRISTGEPLQTTRDLKEACTFEKMEDAEWCANHLRHLLQVACTVEVAVY